MDQLFEANNIYGLAMLQYLPTGGFKWMKVSDIDDGKEFILKQQDEQQE